MRFLLIHQAFASPNDAGGTRHYELGRRLVQHGHTFTIVASKLSYLTGKRTGSEGGLVAEQRIDGVRILRAWAYPSLHKSFVWRVVSFISFMLLAIWAALRAGPVDLVMGTSPPIFQAVSAMVVASLRRRPFLLEVRDLWPEFAIDMGILTNPVLIFLSRKLEHVLYDRANHILVNSPAYRDYILSKGIPESKVTLIPNGVDPNMFDPSADGSTVREIWNLHGKAVVTYAGALGTANDIPTIIQAAAQLRDEHDIHFLLVGDGKERAHLEKLANNLNLTNVLFTGSQPKSKMRDILAASDICLATLMNLPMFRTTYPNKVFDYMAAGRPTILGIDGVIRQVIEAAEGGVFVQPGDPSALAQAVLELVHDRPNARQMGANARAYVVEHFNRNDQARDFQNLMEHLAQQG